MKIPKRFSGFEESPLHKSPSNNPMCAALDNIHFDSLINPVLGIATPKKSLAETFEIISKLQRTIYKFGVIDFTNVKTYSLVKRTHPFALETDRVVIKIHKTYIDYKILKNYVLGKRRVYYATKGEAPVYIQVGKEWWFFIGQLSFYEPGHKLIESKKKSNIIGSII